MGTVTGGGEVVVIGTGYGAGLLAAYISIMVKTGDVSILTSVNASLVSCALQVSGVRLDGNHGHGCTLTPSPSTLPRTSKDFLAGARQVRSDEHSQSYPGDLADVDYGQASQSTARVDTQYEVVDSKKRHVPRHWKKTLDQPSSDEPFAQRRLLPFVAEQCLPALACVSPLVADQFPLHVISFPLAVVDGDSLPPMDAGQR